MVEVVPWTEDTPVPWDELGVFGSDLCVRGVKVVQRKGHVGSIHFCPLAPGPRNGQNKARIDLLDTTGKKKEVGVCIIKTNILFN